MHFDCITLVVVFMFLYPVQPFKMSVLVFQENLQQWLTDKKARDQLVIRSGPDTEVLWNDARQKTPEPVHKRSVSYLHLVCLSHICYLTV